MKQLPNFFTLLNLVFGSLAITYILQTGETIAYIDGFGFSTVMLPEKMAMGSIFIFAAAVVDFLDGFVARLFKATSAIGKQLDSLADIVSFGVAPGMILYQLLRISFAKEESGLEVSIAALLPALLIPCAAAWRLAKFNLANDQEYSFKGLPTPAAGIMIASFPLIVWFETMNIHALFFNQWFLYGVILLLGFLMISRIPMLSLKFKDFSLKNNIQKIILLVIAIVASFTLEWLAIPAVLVSYILVSLAFKSKIS